MDTYTAFKVAARVCMGTFVCVENTAGFAIERQANRQWLCGHSAEINGSSYLNVCDSITSFCLAICLPVKATTLPDIKCKNISQLHALSENKSLSCSSISSPVSGSLIRVAAHTVVQCHHRAFCIKTDVHSSNPIYIRFKASVSDQWVCIVCLGKPGNRVEGWTGPERNWDTDGVGSEYLPKDNERMVFHWNFKNERRIWRLFAHPILPTVFEQYTYESLIKSSSKVKALKLTAFYETRNWFPRKAV